MVLWPSAASSLGVVVLAPEVRTALTFSPSFPGRSGIDHHLVVPGVERGHLLGRQRPAAAPQLSQLAEEALPRDPGREQDEEGHLLVTVVAESVRPALVHESGVTRPARLPRPCQ